MHSLNYTVVMAVRCLEYRFAHNKPQIKKLNTQLYYRYRS